VWEQITASLRMTPQRHSWRNELVLAHRDGFPVPVEVAGVPYRGPSGAIEGFITSMRPLASAQVLERMKWQFMDLVSHELRTPMTVLAGTLHVAGLPNITPEQRDQMLRDARQSAAQLGQILDNLVELARHQAGRLRLTAEPTDVRQLLRDIVRGEESGLEGFRLSLDLAEDLPSMEVDRVRVRQVIRNLLSNAAKYSPAGTEIKVAAVRREKHVIVSVRDRGRGMTPDEQSRLFQPFERLEQSTADSGGLGLGLVVCRRLVDAHGGDIWVESGPGEGSCFYFTLPLGS
jgi:signal transduction histidine kinase